MAVGWHLWFSSAWPLSTWSYYMSSVSNRRAWTSLHRSQGTGRMNTGCARPPKVSIRSSPASLSLHSIGQSKSQTSPVQGEEKQTSPLERRDKVKLKTWRNCCHHLWKQYTTGTLSNLLRLSVPCFSHRYGGGVGVILVPTFEVVAKTKAQ